MYSNVGEYSHIRFNLVPGMGCTVVSCGPFDTLPPFHHSPSSTSLSPPYTLPPSNTRSNILALLPPPPLSQCNTHCRHIVLNFTVPIFQTRVESSFSDLHNLLS